MAMPEHLLSSLDKGVLTLTLNNPEKLNALTATMQRELHAAVMDAGLDPDVRVVIVTGAGKSFCSGGDVTSFGKPDPGDPMAVRHFDNPEWTGMELRVERLTR